MVSAWRNFKNIFSRPLFTIIFRPEVLQFHPYSILTGDTMVGFVIFCVLKEWLDSILHTSSIVQSAIIFKDDASCFVTHVHQRTFSKKRKHSSALLGTIHILRKQVFGHFLTHPLCKNDRFSISKHKWPFLNPPFQLCLRNSI